MNLQDRIKAKLLGQNPVPLENLCDLPVSMGYTQVAGTVRALHAVAEDLTTQVETLQVALKALLPHYEDMLAQTVAYADCAEGNDPVFDMLPRYRAALAQAKPLID